MNRKNSHQGGGPCGPTVRCAFTEMSDIDKLVPNALNPNKHPTEQLELYWKIVLHQGIRRAIVVSNQSGKIVTGHGLYETLKFHGVKQAPIDRQDFKTPADEHAHLLADNRLPQIAHLDASALGTLEQEITTAGLDLEFTGVVLEVTGETVSMAGVATQTPPKFTWVLIGLPTVRFGEIAERIEGLAGIKDIFLETTSNNGPKR